MGKKVNFNPKKNKIITNRIKVIFIIILIIFFLCIVIKSAINAFKGIEPNQNNLDNINYNHEEYSSFDDIWKNYNIKYLNGQDNTDKLVLWVSFNVDLFTGETSNQRYFTNLSKTIASFIDYKNFELIDESKNIDIEVFCENRSIVSFLVNGDSNYFQNKESEINALKVNTQITQFSIQSSILKTLNENEWSEIEVNFGTQDSTCDGYKIFFDEGIKYKVVGRNIFNIVFTKNYTDFVAGGLRPTATTEQVISALGEPTFNEGTIYGYKGEKNYLFFDFVNNQISCYPVVSISEEDETNLKEYINRMNETKDIKEFATQLTRLWLDYDVYDYDNDYVDLKYTLKGVNLNISNYSLENGIYIYQNYTGNKNIADLDNVYIKNGDFVNEEEKDRAHHETLNHTIEGDFPDEEEEPNMQEFLLSFKVSETTTGPLFYSLSGDYPDTELNSKLELSSYMWYDNYNFIYSVNNDGIYVFNCVTMENKKLKDIKGEIIINSVTENQIVYNNKKTIDIF